jgi:hypothetical protein
MNIFVVSIYKNLLLLPLPFGTSWNRQQSYKVSKDTFMKLILYKTEYVNISTPSKELSGYCSYCIQQQTAGNFKLKFWTWKIFTFFTEKLGMYSTHFLQNVVSQQHFLGIYTKLWKATISFVISVCLAVCMELPSFHWNRFSWNLTFEYFLKIGWEN